MGWDELAMQARQGKGVLRHIKPAWRALHDFRVPVFRPLAALLYAERNLRLTLWPVVAKIFYREPLLRYRCARVGRGLQLEGAIPEIVGDGRIELGDQVYIGDRNTWVVGTKVAPGAELIIGDRVAVNHQTMISAARSVRIGDDTLIAGNVRIFDNTSHPVSPARRLRHESFTLDETAPVVIGKNVWIGQYAMVMRGVTIGDNSVVAAGSVVTRSVPPNTLVAGSPAVVVKDISDPPELPG